MSAYFVAHIRVHDEALYRKYLDGVDKLSPRYEREYLAVDTAPQTLEGETVGGRVVIIRFPNEEALRRWYHSDEYQAILPLRLGAADCAAVLVHGCG